jgi:hypothetical protein
LHSSSLNQNIGLDNASNVAELDANGFKTESRILSKMKQEEFNFQAALAINMLNPSGINLKI